MAYSLSLEEFKRNLTWLGEERNESSEEFGVKTEIVTHKILKKRPYSDVLIYIELPTIRAISFITQSLFTIETMLDSGFYRCVSVLVHGNAMVNLFRSLLL
jgi:hypothetical protein